MKTPLLDQLAGQFEGTHEDSFFNEWKRIKSYNSEPNRLFYERLELWISSIPQSEMSKFEKKISLVHHRRDRRNYRDWEKLFDTLNESFGFHLLATKYDCQFVEFFEQEGKSPDLHGVTGDRHIYLESKTINHSQEERRSWHYDDIELPCIDGIPPTLERKIKSVYENAIEQLEATPPCVNKKLLVSMVINVDHQISGFPDSDVEMCLRYLNSIENPNYFIEFIVH